MNEVKITESVHLKMAKRVVHAVCFHPNKNLELCDIITVGVHVQDSCLWILDCVIKKSIQTYC